MKSPLLVSDSVCFPYEETRPGKSCCANIISTLLEVTGWRSKGMQMDGRLKELQVSLPRSTDLSLVKGDRRHGEGRHASRVSWYQEH